MERPKYIKHLAGGGDKEGVNHAERDVAGKNVKETIEQLKMGVKKYYVKN